MTANKRIFLNIVATYGRSLFALFCGLFTARWTLQSLGEIDYGLYGVVGGLTAFVTFFNTILASSVGRFYAFSVGQAKTFSSLDEGVENCRKWFTLALAIHSIIPFILIVIGYPIGEWAVRNWLTIPPDRIEACVWVWRFVCVSCFVSMVNVPFQAMYTAKQYIAELTIYSFVTTTLNVCFLYYMVEHPGEWLTKYALWATLLSVVPQIIIAIRAYIIFPECRFRKCYLRDKLAIKELFLFATHRIGGALAVMSQNQGLIILVNKLLGPNWNASMTIGHTVAAHSETLSTAVDGALLPAITDSCGAKDWKRMLALTFSSCKFSSVLMAIFALPLMLEVEKVMELWLKTPPTGAASLCVYYLVMLLLERLSGGYYMAIFAKGKIGEYQLLMSFCGLSSLPMAFVFIYLGMGLDGVGLALVIAKCFAIIGRLYCGRKQIDISPWYWITRIFTPFVIVAICTLLVGAIPVLLLPPSFWRICLTTLCCEVLILPLAWSALLNTEERVYACEKVSAFFSRICVKR